MNYEHRPNPDSGRGSKSNVQLHICRNVWHQAVREAKVDIVSADAQPVSLLGTSRHLVIRDPDEMYVEFIQQ